MRGSAVTVSAAVAAAALGLAACSSSGTQADGVVPPPASSTSSPAVTPSPAATTVAAPTTTTPPAAVTASPTPTTGDAAIFAGVQAYNDGFVAAVQQRDIAPFKAVLDPKSESALLTRVTGLVQALHDRHWTENFTQTLSDLRRTTEKGGRACVDGTEHSSSFDIRDETTGAFIKSGSAGVTKYEFCLRNVGEGTWRVYEVLPVR